MHERRIVEPIYQCTIQSHGQTQGKIYAILCKRRADIIDNIVQGTDCHIICHLPVAESIGFIAELRDKTHGAATAYLTLDHWKIAEGDPYFIPTTPEELEEYGIKRDKGLPLSVGESLLIAIKKRKGLYKRVLI